MKALAILVLLALGGCVAQSVPSAKVSTIRTVGIISALGDRLTVQRLGITVFDANVEHGEMTGWGLDDFVIDTAKKQLVGRYDVRPVTYDKADFDTSHFYFPEVPGLRGDKSRPIGEVLRTGVSPQGLDAYVIIVRTGDHWANTSQHFDGVGLLHGAFDSVIAFACYSVIVVDGHDFKVIASIGARMPDWEPFDLFMSPHDKVPETMWAEKFADLTAAQKRQITGAIEDLVARSLPDTLRREELLK